MKRKKPRSATSGKETSGASSPPAGGPKGPLAEVALPDAVPRFADPSPGSPPLGAEPSRPEAGCQIPAILLEGDEPCRPALGGPGEKFALGPTPSAASIESRETELKASYGTGRLLLTPRDPHCLYACWDLTDEQQRLCNSLSTQHHLLIRLYPGTVNGRPIDEVHVHPESRHWFVHVEHAGRTYIAELGYPQPDGQFRTVALSEPATTPPNAAAEERAVEFKTISFESAPPAAGAPPPNLAPLVTASVPAIASAVSLGSPGTPEPVVRFSSPEQPPQPPRTEASRPTASPLPAEVETLARKSRALREVQLTQAQERSLAEVTGWKFVMEQSAGSAEIAALLRGPAQPAVSPLEAAPFEMPPAPLPEISGLEAGQAAEVSSPTGGEFPAQQNFWFNLNAELVIYGATEPDALVTIGGRPIPLRPDGSFSCRFALPDGYYQLAVSAVGPNGDARHAKLEFYRGTRYRGEVGIQPQDPALKPPRSENAV